MEEAGKLTAENNIIELQQHFLQNYLCYGSEEILKKAAEMIDLSEWKAWRCAILLESSSAIFDTDEDVWEKDVRKEIPQNFFYLNLSGSQSLLLFNDTGCDYRLVAKRLYTNLKRSHQARIYISISKIFDGYQDLPEVMGQLERQMEERFYRPEGHIFFNEEDILKTTGSEAQDSQLIQRISEDIARHDIGQLWKHFHKLTEKYGANTQFSALYVKFVFSNIIQELFQEDAFAREHNLEKEFKRVYNCTNAEQILNVVEEKIIQYEKFVNHTMDETPELIEHIKQYVSQHYDEELNIDILAKMHKVYPGYLCYFFKRKVGINLKRFIWIYRMIKAKEYLEQTNKKIEEISRAVGFKSEAYFYRSFCAYYGYTPEAYRARFYGIV